MERFNALDIDKIKIPAEFKETQKADKSTNDEMMNALSGL
jgi:hypothetical protein